MEEEFFPVCSPELLKRGPRLREPADLSRHVLLHQQYVPSYRERDHGISDQFGWTDWLAAIGADDVDGRQGLYFSFSHLALQAAVEGQGIALASSVYVAGDLVSGRMVKPLGRLSVRGSEGFFIVCPPETAGREKIVAFRNWALAEAAGGAAKARGL
jgi:LysR family glycine cleavage system transcriptional activator